MNAKDFLEGDLFPVLPPEIHKDAQILVGDALGRFQWSPSENILAIPERSSIKLWYPGGRTESIVGKHHGQIHGLCWSPEGAHIATCAMDGTIAIWDVKQRKMRGEYIGHASKSALSIDWSLSSSTPLATGGADCRVALWDRDGTEWLCNASFEGHTEPVTCVAWSPKGSRLASSGRDGKLFVWDTANGFRVFSAAIRAGAIFWACWSPQGDFIVLGCEDSTVRIVDAATGRQAGALEGHIRPVTTVCFDHTGTFLASKALDESTIIWRWDTWEAIAVIREPHHTYVPSGVAFSRQTSLLATVAPKTQSITIWKIDFASLLKRSTGDQAVHYTNAKIVLVGDTGVGKTALGIVLSGQTFIPTESTHGRHVWTFDYDNMVAESGRQETRETILWDLAGQPGYRLIHQLSFNEISVALVVFDSRNDSDPFAGIRHWARALSQARRAQGSSGIPMKMFLVQARVDRGSVPVSRHRIDALISAFGFDAYFATSAKEGLDIPLLASAVRECIDWTLLPKVSSNALFTSIKTYIIAEKKGGTLLVNRADLFRNYLRIHGILDRSSDLHQQFDACLALVESRGLIRRLSFAGLVLLQPELLDSYGAALLNAAANDIDGLGSIAEETAKLGNYPIPSDERINDAQQERLLLLATIEELLRQEIALREAAQDGPFIVFPSQLTREWSNQDEPPGRSVVFEFEGPVLSIYATLAVRLSHSGTFKRNEMWQKVAVFAAQVGGTCGIKLREVDDGRGELTLFFDSAASEPTRFQFEEYVKSHLRKRVLDDSLKRRRIFECDVCHIEVTPLQVQARRLRGFDWLSCSICDCKVSIWDGDSLTGYFTPDQVVRMNVAADERRDFDASEIVTQARLAAGDFDVFMCHNNEDKSEVRELANRLQRDQIVPWLDERELRPGLPWQRVLENAIQRIRSAAVFVGRSGLGPWQQQEIEAFLNHFVRLGKPVIPVILGTCAEEPRLPIFLKNLTWVDFRPGRSRSIGTAPNPYNLLRWGITGDKQ
jgi:small GTP-binding protein